jgi:hypothetical protein
MITQYAINIFLSSFHYLLSGLFAIIPSFDFLSTIGTHLASGFSFFLGIIDFMNPIIPSTVSLSCLGVYLGYYSFHFGMKFISWVLRKIPVAGMG